MKEYIVCSVEDKDFDNFLLCLSFESIVNYIESIEKDFSIANKSGRMLIDQLLVTGNECNRFISCDYNHGKLNLNSIKNVEPDVMYRKKTMQLLKMNYECVKHSILTEHQKNCIKEEIEF